MKSFNITATVEQCSFDELSAEEQDLVTQARQANRRSYAPYSRFNVGAAIALDNGEVVTGANQENVAYPSGTCAERTTAFYAHARYPEAKFRAIAIAARDESGAEVSDPISPCGACRQVLLQYEMLAGEPVKVLLAGSDYVYRLASVRDLLPLAFTTF